MELLKHPNVRIVDDPKNTHEFLMWADKFAVNPRLRGSDRSVSQPVMKTNVETDDVPVESARNSTANEVFGEARQSSAESVEPTTEVYKTLELPESPTVEKCQPKPVVSIAHRKAYTKHLSLSSACPSVNKLDEESMPRMTSTQAQILQRIEGDDTKENARAEVLVETTGSKPHRNHPSMEPYTGVSNALPSSTSPSAQKACIPDISALPSPIARDASAKSVYDPLAYYKKMQKEFQDVAEHRLKEHDSVRNVRNLDTTLPASSQSLDISGTSRNEVTQQDNESCDTPSTPDASSTPDSSAALATTKHIPLESIARQDEKRPNASSATESDKCQSLDTDHAESGVKQDASNSPSNKRPQTLFNPPEGSRNTDFDDIQSDDDLDLTPVLNVLDLRVEKPHNQCEHSIKINDEADQLQLLTQAEKTCADVLETSDENSEMVANHADATSASFEHNSIAKKDDDILRSSEQNLKIEISSCSSRTAILKNLPHQSDFTLVQSLICGGAIEKMNLDTKKCEAHVKFVNTDNCQKYVKACSSGVRFMHNRKEQVVQVERSTDTEPKDLVMEAYIRCGASRVVQADGADNNVKVAGLYELAEGRPPCREVESVLESYRHGSHTVVFRFTNISDAVSFREKENAAWKNMGLRFVEDPCETAATHW